jgi:hypothetical protein
MILRILAIGAGGIGLSKSASESGLERTAFRDRAVGAGGELPKEPAARSEMAKVG